MEKKSDNNKLSELRVKLMTFWVAMGAESLGPEGQRVKEALDSALKQLSEQNITYLRIVLQEVLSASKPIKSYHSLFVKMKDMLDQFVGDLCELNLAMKEQAYTEKDDAQKKIRELQENKKPGSTSVK
ncbi:MAG: hypothetical protein SFW66_01670 [Gammaproteobacteria bacterium]|nr:hypothetical protein [Gammaproteobacteria bacterium]